MALRRKPWLMALALAALGLSALAATTGLRSLQAEPPTAACASCDARHHNLPRLIEAREAESTP